MKIKQHLFLGALAILFILASSVCIRFVQIGAESLELEPFEIIHYWIGVTFAALAPILFYIGCKIFFSKG